MFGFFAIMAAALVLFTAGWEGLRLYQSNLAVASVITLDVNLSIEIHVNKKEKVLEFFYKRSEETGMAQKSFGNSKRTETLRIKTSYPTLFYNKIKRESPAD